MLSELAEDRIHLGVVNPGRPRRRLEQIVGPGKQVPIDEPLRSQQGYKVGQTSLEGALHLQILHHQHGDKSRPYLRRDDVSRCAHEGPAESAPAA